MNARYWLSHCHGFRVESPSGRIGVVETVLCGADGEARRLAVRGGLFGHRLALVPVESVERVEPRQGRLVVGPAERCA